METRRWTALHPAVMRSNLARSLDRALVALLVAGAMFALLQFAVLPLGAPAGPVLVLFPLDLLAYLCAGLLAWYRRPSNRMGALILWAGIAFFLSAIFNTAIPLFVSVGAIAATLPLATVVHLLHAFPSGRLRGRAPRSIVAGGYITALVLGAPRYLFAPSGPRTCARHRGRACGRRRRGGRAGGGGAARHAGDRCRAHPEAARGDADAVGVGKPITATQRPSVDQLRSAAGVEFGSGTVHLPALPAPDATRLGK